MAADLRGTPRGGVSRVSSRETVLARSDRLEAELDELRRVQRALEAGEPVAVPAAREPEPAAAPSAHCAVDGAAYRDDLEAARSRAEALAEEVASLRRQVDELAERAARDAEARKAREIAKLIEAADRREEQAARDFARRPTPRPRDRVLSGLAAGCCVVGSFFLATNRWGSALVTVILGGLVFLVLVLVTGYE